MVLVASVNSTAFIFPHAHDHPVISHPPFHRYCLTRCILSELDEPIFLRLYSPEWEGGENYSNILVVTLADYFQDLSSWLPSEYFKVDIAHCVNHPVTAKQSIVHCDERLYAAHWSLVNCHRCNCNLVNSCVVNPRVVFLCIL